MPLLHQIVVPRGGGEGHKERNDAGPGSMQAITVNLYFNPPAGAPAPTYSCWELVNRCFMYEKVCDTMMSLS